MTGAARAALPAAPAPQRTRTPGRALPRRQRGYTLIEVIVAFALLALALTLLLGTLSGAARQVRWSDDAGRAALHAQSLLDQTGLGEPLRPGSSDGEFEDGRYRWTMEIVPWRDPSAVAQGGPRDPAAPQLLEIRLDVQWGERAAQRLRLRTLRLVPAGTEAAP